MIAELRFGSGRGVRCARFEAAPLVPLDAACVLANGVREALRALLGAPAVVALGEPVVPSPEAWERLTGGALAFLSPGSATDVAFILGERDALALVHAAFGEPPAAVRASGPGAWSALERSALARIAARCATACDALCADRRGATRAVEPATLPGCAAFFDVRVSAPLAFTIGVGVLRPLPPPEPGTRIAPATLGEVELELRAVLGRAYCDARSIAAWRPGTLVRLATGTRTGSELCAGTRRIARGTCGIVGRCTAFAVHATETNGTSA